MLGSDKRRLELYSLMLIGIDRLAKRNGFTLKMFRELGEACSQLDDEAGLRVGVLQAIADPFTAGLSAPQQTLGRSRQGHHLHAQHRADARG